ncbi:MAG: RelA/SpoT family protein [Cardiobacteriaceae bacterium]|nr:RelA/SpoT family protein [Cardiobacteriaceae bacterium]
MDGAATTIHRPFAQVEGEDFLQPAYAELEAEMANYLDAQDMAAVEKAAIFGAIAHDGQKRQSGGPYFTHPIAVCRLLASQRFDLPVLQAALLHDVLEDTPVTADEMRAEFGDEVTAIVDGVSKLDRLQHQGPQEVQAESFKKMFMAMTDDPRVIIIKLADRLHNMQTLGALRPDKRKRKARETLEVYASIAGRLGLFYSRMQLEDLAFSHLHPWRYAVIKKHYNNSFRRTEVLDRVRHDLKPALTALGIKASISQRQRHLWGLYLRMKRKASFKAASRTVPLRIITENEDDCYRVLGRLHALYRPVSGKFEDYIAAPKSNGYRSLHTSVITPNGDVLNIQIRTREMHTLAETGIIAVWHQHIKERGVKLEERTISAEKYMRDWLSRLKEVQNVTHDPLEFYDAIKKELSSGDIHVYTPRGQVIDLPRGATPLDFAYAIHTEVGNHCVAAKVNGEPYPLFKPLENAQTVQIRTDDNAHPNANWLQFVVTAKARAAINHYLRHLATRQAIANGKRLLDGALHHFGSSIATLPHGTLESYLQAHQLSEKALYGEIGRGDLQPMLVADSLLGGKCSAIHNEKHVLHIHSALDAGIELAECCHPLPREDIVGVMSPQTGIAVHRRNCRELDALDRSQWVRVDWGEDSHGRFAANLELQFTERLRMIADISTAIGETDGSIINLQIARIPYDDTSRLLKLWLEVRDRDHLAQIIRMLRGIDGVTSIKRM